MLTPTGPKVLEYNVRFGDPEAEALLPRLKSDLARLLIGTIDDTLGEQPIEWDPRPSVTVILASGGYPGRYRKGLPIQGVEDAERLDDVLVFHAGTKRERGVLLTNGGRVLAVTALGATREAARERAYDAARRIRFEGAIYRTDIGAS